MAFGDSIGFPNERGGRVVRCRWSVVLVLVVSLRWSRVLFNAKRLQLLRCSPNIRPHEYT
jgi:hypothetical protein